MGFTSKQYRPEALYQVLSSIVNVLSQWQTLIAGLLALAGAGWTVGSIRAQIAQATNLEKERLVREERASKAVLPLALSELVQYALDCIRFLKPSVTDQAAIPVPLDMTTPRIPDTILEPMQACARFADPTVATHIHRVLGALQVQHSRLEGLVQRAMQREVREIWEIEAVGAMLDAAELHALCGALFMYARGKSLEVSITMERQLSEAFIFSHIVAEDHPDLAAALKRRVKNPEFL
jgi:hypothetical protein